jgi:Ca-activated chloride channel family protein
VISPTEATAFAVEREVRVYTVGLGSTGKVQVGTGEDGTAQYAELDEATLKEIAEKSGGKYFRSVDGTTLKEIYAALPGEIKREPEETGIEAAFYVAAVLVLLAQCWIRYGRGRILP